MNTHELWLRALARGQSSRFFQPRSSERGASAVEYGLMIAGIAAIILVAVFALGGGSNGMFQDSCDTIWAQTDTGDCE